MARIELARTGARPLAAALAVIGTVLLVSKQPPFQPFGNWSSTFADAAAWLSSTGLVQVPLIATVAAWVGGRERRLRVGELLATTPRPTAQRIAATWAAVSAGTAAGFVASALVVAAAVAPAVSYYGGRWVGAWWLVALGWLAAAGVGIAVGRLLPGAVVPPLLGLSLYIGTGMLTYLNGAWTQLALADRLPSSGGYRLIAWVVPGGTVWLLGLTAAVVALSVKDLRRWAVLPGALAVVAAAGLTQAGEPADGFAAASWAEPDPGARQMACTTDGGPEVCLFAEHAGLLRAVAPVARSVVVSAAPLADLRSAQETPRDSEAAPDTLPLPDLTGQFVLFGAGLADPEGVRQQAVMRFTSIRCPPDSTAAAQPSERARAAQAAAAVMLLAEKPLAEAEPNSVGALHQRLTANPAEARDWMTSYLRAARKCDLPVLERLAP